MLSEQTAKKYDADETTNCIIEFKKTFEDNYGRERNEEESDWIKQLENNVDEQYVYTYLAYNETPSNIDYESIPFGTKRYFWLDAIYDGFDEICRRLKMEDVEILTPIQT